MGKFVERTGGRGTGVRMATENREGVAHSQVKK